MTKQITEDHIALLTTKGFDAAFFNNLKTSNTHEEAYDKTEEKYIEAFGKKRYKNFESYKQARYTRMKSA